MCLIKADIQALMRLVKANENAPNFDLNDWKSECGTYGCLVGNDVIQNNVINSSFFRLTKGFVYCLFGTAEHSFDEIKDGNEIYGINKELYSWLFSNINISVNEIYQLKSILGTVKSSFPITPIIKDILDKPNRDCKDLNKALNRVRKTIYYILRKRELMPNRETKEGREQYDKTRKMGDVKVSNSVLELVNN